VEGVVEARRSAQATWAQARLDDVFCTGDSLRVQPYGRAAVLLPDETVVRLDQNTTVTFVPPQNQSRSWLEILRGAVHIISRRPTALQVLTPFANAGIEGTEFVVVVSDQETTITVFEGMVAVSNPAGTVSATAGEQVSTRAGQVPFVQAIVRPRDAVQWALYYSPALSQPLPAADETPPPQRARDASFYAARAARRLGVGRVDEAQTDIMQALSLDTGNVEAISLQSIIALTQNDKDEALRLANQAVALNSRSAAALVALSYAQQAFFDVSGALATLQTAVREDPQNALAWARLSELWLAVGDIDQALAAARTAVSLNPRLERTQTVLGFAYLTQVRIPEALDAFEQGITLDQGAPLPRLGRGLALIRRGDLEEGREQIAIAVILDPGNSLIRSYVGKAYYEEKRDDLAESQLAIAKTLDPLDSTPFFYDAIRKQTINRPLEALRDVNQSIELNDNRAVYRSRLLLDEDLAARSASLARVYRDVGFDQLALLEGWKSLDSDFHDYSGHRLLADTYATLPRHEIGRVSELFQSQLLQPLNITPVPPQLAEANLFILDTSGPASIGFNEFNPVFNRNRVAVQASGVAGGNETQGEDVTVAGVLNRWSYSVGQFGFDTDGFRANNDLEQDVANGFVQFRPSEKMSVLGEVRSSERDQGDLRLLFNPQNYIPNLRATEDIDSWRLGVHRTLSPRGNLLGSVIGQDVEIGRRVGSVIAIDRAVDVVTVELEHLYRAGRLHLATGARRTEYEEDRVTRTSVSLPFPPFLIQSTTNELFDVDSSSAFVYATVDLTDRLALTVGAAGDSVDGLVFDRDDIDPKLGIAWESRAGTIVRAAAFQTLQPTTFSRQDVLPRLEPTHVAGLNQFFAGSEGERARNYGIDVDHSFSEEVYLGARLLRRVLDVPYRSQLSPPATGFVDAEAGVEEEAATVFAYWAPTPRLAVRAEYQHEETENDPNFTPLGFLTLTTDRVPLEIRYFYAFGLSTGLRATYVDQSGVFQAIAPPFVPSPGDDQFWSLDVSARYRLPNRRGIVSLDVLNALDEEFRYQDTDPENPRIFPERLAQLKFTIAF
jgi:tetratricopeptide (TPR) repeat protein